MTYHPVSGRPTVRFPTGDDDYIYLPAVYEVCDRCDGEGTHTNPAIDGNGITASEMDELGEDFREDYLAGVYDVRCEECGGKRVVPVVDRGRADAALLAEYEEYLDGEREYRLECAAEARAFGYDR